MIRKPISRILFTALLLTLAACGGRASIDIRHINNSHTVLTFTANITNCAYDAV